ncbi:MAG: glycosyltransferase family 9 protein [Firmicutes bacterium]|nr:glycosyltransferase family 9 protein [Bacillota bacterium]MCM1401978.1 glycosyltransferase family 9 protein [Bacteroides sp.]MCM1477180.1 glycosyltransferase family 9 protein [Bacteroides sp.]
MRQEHVLIIRFSALGDVAMTLPVVYSVARANKDVRFTVVTRPFFARLFVDAPANVEVTGIDPKEFRGIGGTLRLLRKLNRLRATAVADLHNVLRSWIIDLWFGLKPGVRVAMVDKRRRGRREALRSGEQQRGFTDRYMDVFHKLGLKGDAADYAATLRQLKRERGREDDAARPRIGLAPFARYYNKTYPPEMMRQVAELLCKRGANVFLFGGRGAEAEQLEQWASAMEGCECVAGKYGIEEEMELMRSMDVMASMDSANQHLASLVGTPVVTLWGSTTPECGFMPYGQPRSRSLVADVDCQPCTVAGSATCPRGDFRCMKQLSPEMVADKLMSEC